MHDSSVTVDNDALLNFTNNSAENGGAIALYGSWITVSNNSQLVFKNNTVTGFGGAIYVYMTEEVYLPYSHHCFIRSTVNKNPWNWTSNFSFDGNRYNNTLNAIYATSILPCVWKRVNNVSLDDSIKETICNWPGWKFGGTCSDMITTSPRNFSSTLKNIRLYPGIPSEHLIYAQDDFGHNVTTFFVDPTVVSHKGEVSAHVNNRILTVWGNNNSKAIVKLLLKDNRPLEMTVNVSLKECPGGFEYNSDSHSCICKDNQYIHCTYNDSRRTANIVAGYCMSYSQYQITPNTNTNTNT